MQRREFCKLMGLTAAVTAVDAAAETEKSDSYVHVNDSLVLRKLDQWQDWKFGFMMH
jgi:alpha-L-fucosidase